MQQKNQEFQEALARLNPVQREAVEQIEGPVLVIAGPGTGKTQILSARIGEILSQPDTRPHNILCLTYTDAGTVAMRKRLLQFIGPDAYRVHIFTFHGFCNQVIQENLDRFGYKDLKPVSELESIELYHRLIDSFPTNHPLKRLTGEIYFDTYRLRALFDLMKREAWSIEFVQSQIQAYLEELPEREKFIYKRANAAKGIKAGDPKTNLIEKEKADMEKLSAAAEASASFYKLMSEKRRYDYNDMILWVLEAFRNDETFLLQYQERYHYFLVDEYQDTNGAQNEILNLLTTYWPNPNIFVVGDDDQAIYRFQGANISNIIDFYDRYKDENIRLSLMEENYRSTQAILNAAASLIIHNDERLVNKLSGLSKNLKASNPSYRSTGSLPEIWEFETTIHEEAALFSELKNLWEQDEDLSEIAVIYRNHRTVENLVKLLEREKIPLSIKQKVDILQLPLIRNLVNLLRYIYEEFETPDSSEALLYEILHYEFFHISPRDIARINRHCREGKQRKAWREVLGSRETLFRLNLETASAISAFEENLDHWIKNLQNETIQTLFEKILTRGGILSWVLNQPDKIWYLQVITTFFDFIKDESAKSKFLTLKELLNALDLMYANGIAIPLNKNIFSEKGVNFLTAHGSKGLEFKKVFLIGATASAWDKSVSRGMFRFPDTLIPNDEEERREDERRLFYVAMTRARESLVISYAREKASGKEEEESRFVAELTDGGKVVKKTATVTVEELQQYQVLLMLENPVPEIRFLDEDFLREELKDYRMSVTHLNKYLRCPLAFYFENVLKVPTARNESMGFGSAVHYALFQLFLQMQQTQNREFPSQEEFLGFFEQGMKMYHSHFTQKEYERKMEYGRQILPLYYENHVADWNKVTKPEYRITHCQVAGVPITGALDKIEFDHKSVNVVDYKTGKPENGRKKLQKPSEREPLGGEYWRQLVFYKLLLDNDKSSNYTMVSGEIDFIQPDQKNEFVKAKIVVNPEDTAFVTEQIKTVYKSIMNLEFTQGCGEKDCGWCNFVKYNYKPEALMEVKPAEEDEG